MVIIFGATAPKLSAQVQGLDAQYDLDADAITRLHVRGLLPDAEAHRARRRLVRKIDTLHRVEGAKGANTPAHGPREENP